MKQHIKNALIFVLSLYFSVYGLEREEELAQRKGLISQLENKKRLDCDQVKQAVNSNPFTSEVVEKIKTVFNTVSPSELVRRGKWHKREGELEEVAGGNAFVFTLKSLPEFIFKLEQYTCPRESKLLCDEKGICVADSLFKRFTKRAYGAQVLIDNCLDLLYIPAALIFMKPQLTKKPSQIADTKSVSEPSSLWDYLVSQLRFWQKDDSDVPLESTGLKEETAIRLQEITERRKRFSIENCPILVEEKADIGKSIGRKSYSDIYMFFYSHFDENPRLLAYFKELFRQLTIFICKTGHWDIKYNNIPFDLSRKQIALLDLDNISPMDKRLVDKALEGITSLLFITSPALFDTILDTASQCLGLSKPIIAPDVVEQARTVMQDEIETYKAYSEFLTRRGITRADEPISIDPESIGLTDPAGIWIMQKIVETINDRIQEQSKTGGSFREIRSVLISPIEDIKDGPLAPAVTRKFNYESHIEAAEKIRDVFYNYLPKSQSIFQIKRYYYGDKSLIQC